MKDRLEKIIALETKYSEAMVQTEHKAKQRVQRSNDDALDIIESREQELKAYKKKLMGDVDEELKIEKKRLDQQFSHDEKEVREHYATRHDVVIKTMIDEVFNHGNR